MAGIVTPRAEGVPHPQITPGTPGAVRTVPVSHPQLSRPPEGLYDPAAEHDACGVAFVATLRGTPGRDIVDAALTALANLNHRGAVGAEADSGDGAGILTQVPDAFIRDVVGADLPAPGHYAIGLAFLPTDADALHDAVVGVEKIVRDEGLELLAWRDVPVKPEIIGPTARSTMPVFRHLVVADPTATASVPGGTGSPTTAWWCWRARPACWTSTRHASCARAGSSPGGCSWWTPGQDGSSMTTRSRRSWPPSGRTRAGSPSTRCGSNSCPNASTSNTPRHPSGVGSGPSGTPRRSSRCSSRRWR